MKHKHTWNLFSHKLGFSFDWGDTVIVTAKTTEQIWFLGFSGKCTQFFFSRLTCNTGWFYNQFCHNMVCIQFLVHNNWVHWGKQFESLHCLHKLFSHIQTFYRTSIFNQYMYLVSFPNTYVHSAPIGQSESSQHFLQSACPSTLQQCHPATGLHLGWQW